MKPFAEFFEHYIPDRLNVGRFASAYTLPQLDEMVFDTTVSLPVVALGMPARKLKDFGELVLPPLYLQAMDQDLREGMINRILQTFPYYPGTRKRQRCMGNLKVIEYPSIKFFRSESPDILGISVDPAIEQHGPHLPLGTESFISHAVLTRLEKTVDSFGVGLPVDYGSLTWSLPHGMSINMGTEYLSRYVQGFANAMMQWARPKGLYVVMTHGSKAHRKAVEKGLGKSFCQYWKTRWLLEPLGESMVREDNHAGGLHTALMREIQPALVDGNALEGLAERQLSSKEAQTESHGEFKWIDRVEESGNNGIFGDIERLDEHDAPTLMDKMVGTAAEDVDQLAAEIRNVTA